MVRKGNWSFLKVAVSPKQKKSCLSKLVCVYLTSIYSCRNFLSQFRSIEFFDDHGLYIVHGQKGKLVVFEGSSISEIKEVTLTKMHALDINL